jgi:ABC-type nitrate/sulfonate/bicarbonate transport system substrate-binding protein
MRTVFAVVVGWLLFVFTEETSAAEKIRVGFVSPGPGLSAPWIARETGGFARHGLDADVILLPGSPRLVQSLIAGDVHYALVGAAAVMRARMRGADVVILGASTNVSSQKLVVNPKAGIRT